MKYLFAISALVAASCAQVVQAQTITLNVANPPGCTISGITSLTPAGNNAFNVTGGTATNCGQTTCSGSSCPVLPVVTINPQSQSYTLASTAAPPQFTWSATNAIRSRSFAAPSPPRWRRMKFRAGNPS